MYTQQEEQPKIFRHKNKCSKLFIIENFSYNYYTVRLDVNDKKLLFPFLFSHKQHGRGKWNMVQNRYTEII